MGKPVKISGVVITFNEEKNLARCLESLKKVTDEIIIVDSFSTDGTEAIARQFGAVFHQRPWEGYSSAKNYGNQLAQHPYILSLDADEALSPALIHTLLNEKKNGLPKRAYSLVRQNIYNGKTFRFGAFRPDKRTRLWKKDLAQWEGVVHEKLAFKSAISPKKLSGYLHHYIYNRGNYAENLSRHLNRINRYTSEWAEDAHLKGKKVIWAWHLILYPPTIFMIEYIIRLGVLDGTMGILSARLSALNKYMKYKKLYALNREAAS